MAEVTTGYHWDETNPEQITGAKLNATGSGTTTNIVQGDMASGYSVITIGTSAPTTATGVAWFDTSQGAGRGLFKLFDNGRWSVRANGFLGWNNGTGISRGNLVYYDSSLTPATVDTVPVAKTPVPTANSVQMTRPVGVAAEAVANGGTGVFLDYGYATCIKDAATVTAGHTLAASITTAGFGTDGNLGSWGTPGGSAAFGYWTDTNSGASGTEVSCVLFGSTPASWVVFKNSAGTVVFNDFPIAAAGDNDKWSGSFATPAFGTFSTAPIGTIARICQCHVFQVTDAAATVARLAFGLRAKNATVTVDTGAAFASGLFHARGAGTITGQAFRCQLIVQETTAASSNQCEFYFETSGTVTGIRVHVQEVGVIVGGQIA